jgi:hypothetical protein
MAQSKHRASLADIEAKRSDRSKKKELEIDVSLSPFAGAGLEYVFSAHTIRISEDWSGPTSGMQWIGGVVLARFFDDRSRFPHGSFEGKRIIEMGAGCGLTSLLLLFLGANVTMTDIDLSKASPNVFDNVLEASCRERLQMERIDWHDPDVERFDVPFDYIVAGDCCYQPAAVEPLLRTMWLLSSAHTVIYLCGMVSDAALDAFNQSVGLYFDVERLSLHLSSADCCGPPLLNTDDPLTRTRALMRLHRKS